MREVPCSIHGSTLLSPATAWCCCFVSKYVARRANGEVPEVWAEVLAPHSTRKTKSKDSLLPRLLRYCCIDRIDHSNDIRWLMLDRWNVTQPIKALGRLTAAQASAEFLSFTHHPSRETRYIRGACYEIQPIAPLTIDLTWN